MKNLTMITTLLLSAPMCMVAKALDATTQNIVNQLFSNMHAMASVLEKATPATADRSVSQLDSIIKRLNAVEAASNGLSAAQQNSINNDPNVHVQMRNAMNHLENAKQKLKIRYQNASPAERAQLNKVLQKLSQYR